MFSNSQPSHLIINKNGKPGRSGKNGDKGKRASAGFAGQDGEPGGDASPISIILTTNELEKKIIVTDVMTKQEYPLTLGDSNASIYLTSNGGPGGAGGLGGAGGQGESGADGRDATESSSGTNGENGHPGADGGPGGKGGPGGNGADTLVTVRRDQTDLLSLIEKPNTKEGPGGTGGNGGEGGDGGSGGRGGNSYSWTEYTYTTYTDSDGNCQTMMVPVSRSNSGGSAGSSGTKGRTGLKGQNGEKGKAGHFSIFVPRVGHFPGPYDLAVTEHRVIKSQDDIIEPEEKLEIRNLTFKNIGDMPTPKSQKVIVYLTENNWVKFAKKDSLFLSTHIHPKTSVTLSEPLQFQIKIPPNLPAIDETFNDQAKIEYGARLTHVNKDFKSVAQQASFIEIRYPLEISVVCSTPTISLEEEAPFAIKIRNISTQALGKEANPPRAFYLEFLGASKFSKKATFRSEFNLKKKSLSESTFFEINKLKPGKEESFAGMLHLNKNTPANTHVKFAFILHLEKINDPKAALPIQTRTFNLQLANQYHYDPKADFVLVTNSGTTFATIEQWKIFARKILGTDMSIWNTSLYSGLSFHHKRDDEGSFIEQLSGKIVIILNNTFQTDAQAMRRSTSYLGQTEIFEAAVTADIATYVVGQFDFKTSLVPSLAHETKSYTSVKAITKSNEQERRQFYSAVDVNKRMFLWQKPCDATLKKKAKQEKEKYRKSLPTENNIVLFDYHPEKKKGNALSRIMPSWHLGSLEFRSVLKKSTAHIAHRPTTSKTETIDEHDKYAILKLTPFARKLTYFVNILKQSEASNDDRKIISSAILSDLTNELKALCEKWRGPYSKEKLRTALVLLNTLTEYNFSTLVKSDERKALCILLLEYEYLLKRLPTTTDHYVLPMLKRRHMIFKIGLECVQELLTQHGKGLKIAEARLALTEQFNKITTQGLMKLYSHPPYSSGLKFNNELNEKDIFCKQELPETEAPQSTFKEGQNRFNSEKARRAAMAKCEEKCAFDLELPRRTRS